MKSGSQSYESSLMIAKKIFMSCLVARFPCSALHTFRPIAFFSSTTTLLNGHLIKSQELARNKLKRQGFPDYISTTASSFVIKDLQLLKVSFQPALLESDILPNNADGMKYIYWNIYIVSQISLVSLMLIILLFRY